MYNTIIQNYIEYKSEWQNVGVVDNVFESENLNQIYNKVITYSDRKLIKLELTNGVANDLKYIREHNVKKQTK